MSLIILVTILKRYETNIYEGKMFVTSAGTSSIKGTEAEGMVSKVRLDIASRFNTKT